MENMEKLGQVYLTSGKVVVADPCYGRECVKNTNNATIVELRQGMYEAYCSRSDDNRISALCIIPAMMDIEDVCYGDYELGVAGVDSGTCGIFCNDYHKKTHAKEHALDDWYNEFIIADDCPESGITDDSGVFTSSGYGDGCYPVFAVTDRHGNQFGVLVEFIYEGWEDEDDEYYEDDEDEDEDEN